ncbi:hypothetical protein F4801DRAFT_528307 [Xylaria longipes]|nr:hypothetical protein F4801DRAFT_528307 [Xylaria longipes]
MARQYIKNGVLSSTPPTSKFNNIVATSLIDSLVMAFLITLLPGILLSWFGELEFITGSLIVFLAILADSGPRLEFFARRRWNADTTVLIGLALAMATLFFETLCLFSFVIGGYPLCELYLPRYFPASLYPFCQGCCIDTLVGSAFRSQE